MVRDWEKKFAEKRVRLIADFPNNLPNIRADEQRLQEIVSNLLDNALKYSTVDGEVRISTHLNQEEVELSVSDTGSGISREDLPRIFERFYRADKARTSAGINGTGLGLSIVKHIAQLHGGRVRAESELGRGTTICVSLPVEMAAAKSVVTQT
jgi:signal transduction histidine kinase